MNEPQPATRRYWILRELPKGPDPAPGPAEDAWVIADYLTGMLPDDVAYFCQPGPDAHVYGWGYVDEVFDHTPEPGEDAGYAEEYLEALESSMPPREGAIQPGDTFVRIKFGEYISPQLQLSNQPGELAPLQQWLLNPLFEGVELKSAQAAAVNDLIRALGLEAPPDPPAAESGDGGEGDEGLTEERRLGRILEKYKLSDLSRAVLQQAGEFALTRTRYPGTMTTSTLLFAALSVGSRERGAGTAARFLYEWFNEHRPGAQNKRFEDFMGGGGVRESKAQFVAHEAHLSSRAERVVLTARLIAHFVRKRDHADRELIHGRDLIAALLLGARDNPGGAAQRLGSMDVNVRDILKDYHFGFLDSTNNMDDSIENWGLLLSGNVSLSDLEEPPPPEPDRKYLPHIDADAAEGKDLLDIKPEVEGFASIIAAESVKTPLAIGLFGDWGSGKSFFISKLKQQVADITKGVKGLKEGEQTPYLGNIVQIDFNAWHYVEANLWASLVSHVFDNLNRTDDKNQKLADERKQFLLAQLDITLSAQREAEARVRAKEEKYESAKAALDAALREKSGASLSLRRLVRKGIWPLVKEALDADDKTQELLKEARQRLGREGLPASVKELRAEFEATKNVAGHAQLWFTALRDDPLRGLKVVGLLAALLLVPLGVMFLLRWLPLGELWERAAAGVTPLLTLLGGALAWLRSRRGEVKAATAKLDEAARKLDELYEDARRDYADRRASLEAAVAAGQVEVDAARNTLEAAKKDVQKTVSDLKALEPGVMLEKFVSERAASDDYRKLLGVVALIRRDFKELSNLLSKQGNTKLRDAVKKKLEADKKEKEKRAPAEAATPGGPAASAVGGASEEAKPKGAGADGRGAAGPPGAAAPVGVTDEAVSEKLEEYRIDRIVLYIDDLDRCPPKQVVDVLQAIHLLLAFELFVVVVGVDARWVRHSLRRRFHGMLGGSGEEDDDAGPAKAATPRDYIEKIFQVPFWLRPMSSQASADLLAGLITDAQLRPKADGASAGRQRPPAPAPSDGGGAGGGGRTDGGLATKETTPDAEPRGEKGAGANPPKSAEGQRGAARADGAGDGPDLQPEGLLLEPKERDAMVQLSKVIGRTPRTLKRFVNVYRIIRAGLKGQRLAAFRGTGADDGEYRAVLVLLGVAYGAPDTAPFFFRLLKNWHEEEHPPGRPTGLKDFLAKINSMGGDRLQVLSGGHAPPPDFFMVVGELIRFADGYDGDIPIAVLRRWMPVVVRYTFQLGRMSEEFA